MPALQNLFDQLRAQKGEVNRASDVTPGYAALGQLLKPSDAANGQFLKPRADIVRLTRDEQR
jgi:hypothetical protein